MGAVAGKEGGNEGKKRDYDPETAGDEWRKEGAEGGSLAAVRCVECQEACLAAGGGRGGVTAEPERGAREDRLYWRLDGDGW